MSDWKSTVVNLAFFAALAYGGFFLWQKLADRTDEIVLAGDTTSGRVTYVDATCTRSWRRIRVSYTAGGTEHDREEKVDCAWEVPSLVTVAYLPDRPAQGRVLDPLRSRRRTNAGR